MNSTITSRCLRYWLCCLAIVASLGSARLAASTALIYTNDFEAYTAVATSPADPADANPTGPEWYIADDTALSPTTVGAGVQVINWQTNRDGLANKCLLLQPNSEAQIRIRNAKSGSSYTLEFWTYAVRQPTSDRNFYVVLRGEGDDNNGDDFLSYRVDRATGSTVMYYYDGVGPGTAAWVATPGRQSTDAWQHHRIVIDPSALTCDIYLDDMTTPIAAGVDLARPDAAVPTLLRIINEGDSADDGWFAIDDLSFTVENSINLTATFKEGFEGYPARVSTDDNANPLGPWIATETVGTGSGKSRNLTKVQIIGTNAHSGTNCLKVEGGQRAGASVAWGMPPHSDVQITWWAWVPASGLGGESNYLRMSLYGAEDGNTLGGDCALLGYGVRNTSVGRPTSLTYYNGGWLDSHVDFTPNTWEEYRLITHNSKGRYTIIKNPSSASPIVVVDSAPMIGAASQWGPTLIAAWSSSNGSGHPPAYIDDIEIKSFDWPVVVYTNDFETYTAVATSSSDTADANPTGLEWVIADDTALSPTTAGAGVQVISWLTNRFGLDDKCLLLHPSSEAQVMFRNAKSGSGYTLDFWTYAVRQPTSDRNFYVVLRGEGDDYNGGDFFAYRVDRAAGSTVMYYYDGVGPGAAGWVATPGRQSTDTWQHHRLIIDPNALTCDIYLDDMATPIVTGAELALPDAGVPTMLRIINEGDSADDGWFAIDDLSFTTVESSIDLTTTFTEGFESYSARVGASDNANPLGPWITTETVGAGSGKSRNLTKVQVVGTSVVTPHSGSNCLKVEGGQRAGASVAWGTPPRSDVQITWWARVPASGLGGESNYLRMSLYGAEAGNTLGGDCALLGYGVRNTSVGRPTSLTYYNGGWLDSHVDYTPDTWEEYRLFTRNSQGKYTIIKNPSSASPIVVVDSAPMIGSVSQWGPTLIAAWSSSNGSGHPPVYIDDIEIKSFDWPTITSVSPSAGGILLTWRPASPTAKYCVLRSSSLDGSAFTDISGDLTDTQFTDATSTATAAFYRIVAKP